MKHWWNKFKTTKNLKENPYQPMDFKNPKKKSANQKSWDSCKMFVIFKKKTIPAFVKFKINNNFKWNIDGTNSKQPKIQRKIHNSLWILKIRRKKSANQKSWDSCKICVISKMKIIPAFVKFWISNNFKGSLMDQIQNN